MKVITSILSLIFILSGGAKLAGLEFEIQAFERWGYAPWFMYATGAAEVVGGLTLWWRRWSGLSAAGLSALMVGAAGTHLLHGEWGMLFLASAILGLAVWLTWRRYVSRHQYTGMQAEQAA